MNFDDALTTYRNDLVTATERWHASRRRNRRRLVLGSAAAVAVVAAVLVTTPAWALVRDVLPFWNQPAAPQSVKLDFDQSLNVGAPAGMSPEAAAGETREIMRASFGGKTHTLYVSPAKNGGYCFEWTKSAGGCHTTGNDFPLGVSAMIVPPHDASQPAQTVMIPESEMRDLIRTGVTYWLVGNALSSDVSDVVIRFSDGSSVHPQITWISAPINAGFFAYDVPNDEQSAADHLTEVDAYDAQGNLVERQPMHPMR